MADMARQQHGHVLQTGFEHGLDFLHVWHSWQQAPERPARLFVTALTEQAPSPTDILSAATPALRPMAEQLAAACRGLLPGMHRLVLAGGQVQLTLCMGPADKLLRELDVCADRVLPDTFYLYAPGAGVFRSTDGGASFKDVSGDLPDLPTLRDPEGQHALDPGDVVCFREGPGGAHQVRNDTDEPIRVLFVLNGHDYKPKAPILEKVLKDTPGFKATSSSISK